MPLLGDGVFYAMAVMLDGNRLPAVARGVRGGAIRPAGLIHRLREGSPD